MIAEFTRRRQIDCFPFWTALDISGSMFFRTPVLSYDLNYSDNILIKLSQLFRWYPIFLVHRTANSLDLISLQVFGPDVETSYVANLGAPTIT